MPPEDLTQQPIDGNAPPQSEQRMSMSRRNRSQIGGQIARRFADGKWHAVKAIAASIEADEEHVLATLRNMAKLQTYGCRAEQRNMPKGIHFRIYGKDKAVPVPVLLERLTPIVRGLEEQGRASAAAASPAAVLILAGKLRKLLDEWAQ